MKFYIKAVSIADLKAQNPNIPERTFKTIINIDPTADYDTDKRGKYGPWLVKQYKLGNLTPDTYQGVTDALSELSDPVRKRRYEQKDVNQYQTVKDLIDAHVAAQDVELELSQRQRTRQAHRRAKEAALSGEATGDIKHLVSDGEWDVYTPLTWEGSIALAMEGVDKTRDYSPRSEDNMKATWCTAGETDAHWFNRYTSQGPLYVFINKNDPINKYQSCPASNSWWFNKHDREGGKRAFLQFMEEHPVIGNFFEVRTVGGVQIMGTTIEGYDSSAKEITIPDGVTTFPSFGFPDTCEKVIIPDSITTIGSGVFANSNVRTVEFNNVTTIERNAFKESAIENIDLSKVTLIGSSAFRKCENLTAVNIRSDATLKAYCFADCNLTGTVTQYPETVLSPGAYDNNENLTVVWKDADAEYPFYGIHELVAPADCTGLISANEGRVTVRTV